MYICIRYYHKTYQWGFQFYSLPLQVALDTLHLLDILAPTILHFVYVLDLCCEPHVFRDLALRLCVGRGITR